MMWKVWLLYVLSVVFGLLAVGPWLGALWYWAIFGMDESIGTAWFFTGMTCLLVFGALSLIAGAASVDAHDDIRRNARLGR